MVINTLRAVALIAIFLPAVKCFGAIDGRHFLQLPQDHAKVDEVPGFISAFSLLRVGAYEKALEVAKTCSVRTQRDWPYCELAAGLASRAAGQAQSHFAAAEEAVTKRYEDAKRGVYLPGLTGSAPIKPGEFEELAYFLLNGYFGVAIYAGEHDCNRAIQKLKIFDSLRGERFKRYDVQAEVMSICLYENGQYTQAAEYLQGFIDAGGYAGADEYCAVSYNVAALRAKSGDFALAGSAIDQHLNRCSKREFLGRADRDDDFRIMRKSAEFKRYRRGL